MYEENHPIRWSYGWGALAGIPSGVAIALAALALSSTLSIPHPQPGGPVSTGFVVFWIAVVFVPVLCTAAICVVRFLRRFTIGWLLTSTPANLFVSLIFIGLDTGLPNR